MVGMLWLCEGYGWIVMAWLRLWLECYGLLKTMIGMLWLGEDWLECYGLVKAIVVMLWLGESYSWNDMSLVKAILGMLWLGEGCSLNVMSLN